MGKAAAVFKHHGQHRTQLNGNFKNFAIAVEIEQIAKHNQMPSAGNGQKLSKAFNNPQNQGFGKQQDVHNKMQSNKWVG